MSKFFSVGPSILNANFTILKEECKSLLKAGAGHLHLDVMDGNFVPNISFGMPVVEGLRKDFPDTYLDVHLMVAEPKKWVQDMHKSGASSYVFHTEALDNKIDACVDLINEIDALGMDAGFSIKPGTDVQVALDILKLSEKVKQVLIMTVEPGFGGQSFIFTKKKEFQNLI